jgi:hypothetical protein
LRATSGSGTLDEVSEPAWDRDLVMIELRLLSDVVANTARIAQLLEEEDDGEEAEED